MIPLLAASHALVAAALHRATRLGVNQIRTEGRRRGHQRRDAGKTECKCFDSSHFRSPVVSCRNSNSENRLFQSRLTEISNRSLTRSGDFVEKFLEVHANV